MGSYGIVYTMSTMNLITDKFIHPDSTILSIICLGFTLASMVQGCFYCSEYATMASQVVQKVVAMVMYSIMV